MSENIVLDEVVDWLGVPHFPMRMFLPALCPNIDRNDHRADDKVT